MSTDIDHLAEAKRLILPRTDYDVYGIEHMIAPGTATDRAIIHALIAIAERLPDRHQSPDHTPRPLYSYEALRNDHVY